MRRILLSLAALLCFATPLRAVDATGTWTGTFKASIQCVSRDIQLQIAGPINVFINEPPASSQIAALGTAFAAFPDNILCQNKGADSLPISLNGRTDGTNLSSFVVLLPAQGAFRPTGTISGDTITLSGPSDNGGSISINLTRVDNIVPTSFRVSERYTGTYKFNASFAYRCADGQPLAASGAASLLVFDLGRGVAGGLRLFGFPSVGFVTPTSNGQCGVRFDQNPVNVQLNGTLSAGTDNSFSGFLQIPDFIPVKGTFDLSKFTAVAQTPGGGTLELTLTNPDPVKTAVIDAFSANNVTIARGEPTRLFWRTAYADKVTIDNGVGVQPAVGSVLVRPDQTTVYTLTASNSANSSQKTLTITVRSLAIVQVGDFPNGFTQRPNEGGGTDSFTLVNRGDASTTITLTTSDDFFTLSPSSFPLAAGTAQTIRITGLPKPAGGYRGSVKIAASGGGPTVALVPVGMIVTLRPDTALRAQAVSSRVEVASAAGQDPKVSIMFRNPGQVPLVAIATSAVPFINPPDGPITINPGQTVPVTYSIDSTQRPIDIPLGAATGKVSLRYPGDFGGGVSLLADGPTTTSVSVTLAHVVTPTVGPGIPPPLQPGELALIIAGLGNKSTTVGDLLLGNKQTTPISSFALFISGAGGVQTSAALPAISANSSIELPGVIKNVIGSTSTSSGTAQLRGTDAVRTTIAAIQSNTSLPAGTYSTSLPLLNSSKATPARSTIVLTGLQKTTTAQTDLFVQEMSGVAGSFNIDFLDSSGRIVSSRASQNIDAFGLAEIADAAPSGAASARITNSSTAAQLSAFAMVTNPATSDGWVVTDPNTATGEATVIVPVFSAGSGAQTTLYTTNRSNANVDVTIDVQGPPKAPPRRRGVKSAALDAASNEIVTLAPLETKTMTLSGTSGFVRITGPAGAMTASARSVISSGNSAFGTGLPAITLSSAVTSGQSRRFVAVDDASATSRDSGVPATFRNMMQLVETSGQSATVRLTLQFAVATGSKVTSTARLTRDYTVAANSFVMIQDLGADLLGATRASVGDIRNATVDVEIVGGSGKVMPFLASIDNGSGDMVVRTE